MSMASLASVDKDSGNKWKQLFCEVIYLNKTHSSVKLFRRDSVVINRKIRLEVKTLRTLDCRNLSLFVGIFIEESTLIRVFTEYCPKGSLIDILQNDNIPLNWGFRLSLAKDACEGMNVLHQSKIIHGHLNSNNCVVDDRWTCKITDYGLDSLRYNGPLEKLENFKQNPQNFAYIPYEYRSGSANEKSLQDFHFDVFSFSIVLIELATRESPYEDNDPSSLKINWTPDLPRKEHFNNVVDDESVPSMDDYNKLILSCWKIPELRPSFMIIKRCLIRINPKKMSPVDLMMAMMEKYSNHLESLVVERTKELLDEKAKSDSLLYSMLPKTVADNLRNGRLIHAEWFTSCSIYFSDIVGFTTISASSTPIQVVELLNKLYTAFDQIIDIHNVYKVETIGDAYMVVSGVPKDIGISHTYEIANMALDLVNCCLSFIIPHMPNEPLKIRVGLHSGPVCAGVVGLKMPRYCLFGDTVNTASRMESNGEAYKIHISEAFKANLDLIGGYVVEERGQIEVKGKGSLRTYWLISATNRKTSIGVSLE